MLKLKHIFLFIILIPTLSVFSQNASIRGFVYEKESGEAVLFCNVFLKGTNYGCVTDVNGFFNLTKLKAGKYTLMVTYLGYDSLVIPVELKDNQIASKKLYLEKSSIQLKEAVVSAEKQEMKTEVRTSIVKISPKQITQIPSIGAQPDIAQYLQILPGVIFTGDQGGQLYIRGGPPIENKVLLDGMVIFNPFHSIGLFSVFDTDVIKNVDVYTGGFNAEHGGRISSVMDISTKDGNKKKFGGKVAFDTFGAKTLLEGPIKKQNNESGGSSSFILSAKTSYLTQSSKIFYTYMDSSSFVDSAGLPYNFTDFYGKLSFNSNNGSKINIFGFDFSDKVNYEFSNLHWNSYGGGTNMIIIPEASQAILKLNLSYSNYDITLDENDGIKRNSSINNFNIGLNLSYFYGKNELDYGIDIFTKKTDFNFTNSIGRVITQKENSPEISGYVKYKYNLREKLLVEPGFRLEAYPALSKISPEPRIGIKYNISNSIRMKFAGGLYSQDILSANSNKDVIYLFYGFLSSPESDNLQENFNNKPVTSSLQTSLHSILGFEFDLFHHFDLNVEGYYKYNPQLLTLNRNKLFDDTFENYDKPDILKKDFILETGKAYGVDFLLKYDYKRTYFWAVYSLGYVQRFDGYTEYFPHYDRRHNVNLVLSQTFGKQLNWEASARWNLGSGFPFTKTQGYYELLTFTGGVTSNYTSSNGDLGILYGELNQGRLPYYHRLDANVKYSFAFSNDSKLEVIFSITNIYNRKNIFYFDRVKHQRVNQLPIMPSLGFSLTF